MGSTGDADRKRRELSSISPTAVPANNQPVLPISEDKKLDAAVLQYQNQKLCQKLEAQKIEISAIKNRFAQQEEKQNPYDRTLLSAKKSWEKLVNDLDSCSLSTKGLGEDIQHSFAVDDRASVSDTAAFLKPLEETGATESCLVSGSPNRMLEDGDEKSKNLLRDMVAAVDDLYSLKDQLHADILNGLPGDDSCRQKTFNDLRAKVKNLRSGIGELHLKHKSLTRDMWHHQDIDVKNKAKLLRLKGDLESTLRELEDNNRTLTALKAEKDATKGTFFPVMNLAIKSAAGDKGVDKQRDLQDLRSTLEELTDQSSSRLQKLLHLQGERTNILLRLSNWQNSLKNMKCVSSSQAFQMVTEQLEEAQAKLMQYQALFVHLQAEKDKFSWRERQANLSIDSCDVYRRFCTVADSRINDLGAEIEKQRDARKHVEVQLAAYIQEPGIKEVISKFRAFVSSFPEDMSRIQSQLKKYKDLAANVHSLRADVQSLTNILDRKVQEQEVLSARSVNQESEVQRLHFMVQDLKDSEMELNLFLEMYKRESVYTRDVAEARDLEYEAWSRVHSLKFSLDEQNLEMRVKTAIEAEAMSQQRLAAAEAKIADLRQKRKTSKRDVSRLSEVLKSKNEENEAYLSEIETIGQAYDDMQNQNQQLLQQITERDDYNNKLVLESARARQMHDRLQMEKQSMEKRIKQASVSCGFVDNKAARIEEQVRVCSDLVHKLGEDRRQNLAIVDNTQRRMSDVNISSHQARESLERLQSKVKGSRLHLAELQVSLDKDRCEKKRLEEDLEAAKRKALRLTEEIEGSSPVAKLRRELQEYREILKCGACLERAKEVVITKCYHLFCRPCVQRVMESRHRKCPVCASSFGPNDVKAVYI